MLSLSLMLVFFLLLLLLVLPTTLLSGGFSFMTAYLRQKFFAALLFFFSCFFVFFSCSFSFFHLWSYGDARMKILLFARLVFLRFEFLLDVFTIFHIAVVSRNVA